MAKLTRDDILKLAKLACLDINGNEAEQFRHELSKILDYVEQLQEVNIDDLEPTLQVTGLTSVTRPDEIVDYGISREALLKNVPSIKEGQIKVNRVLT